MRHFPERRRVRTTWLDSHNKVVLVLDRKFRNRVILNKVKNLLRPRWRDPGKDNILGPIGDQNHSTRADSQTSTIAPGTDFHNIRAVICAATVPGERQSVSRSGKW